LVVRGVRPYRQGPTAQEGGSRMGGIGNVVNTIERMVTKKDAGKAMKSTKKSKASRGPSKKRNAKGKKGND
jgi:hypothetical protein